MKKKVSLVLSSGGARGVAHIGVIEALLAQGYDIHAIAGSSMGAVVGGVYAAGKLQAFKEWICDLDRLEVFKLIDFTLSAQGFIRGERVFNEMKKFITDRRIEALNIPFAAVATDIVNQKEIVFKKGSLYTALRASAAIPSVLKPSIIDNAELVDGGVMNPIPIDHVARTKGDLLVVADVNANIPYHRTAGSPMEKQPSALLEQFYGQWNRFFSKRDAGQKRLSYFDLVTRSIHLMQDKLAHYTLLHHRPDIYVPISRYAAGTFDFYKGEALIDAGKEAFYRAMET